jgi:hypothetical protein
MCRQGQGSDWLCQARSWLSSQVRPLAYAEQLLCTHREDEEDRYTFSSRLVGQATPKHTNSLDSPAKGPAQEWEDKGPRPGVDRRIENGPERRLPDVTRPGPARVHRFTLPDPHLIPLCHDHALHTIGAAVCSTIM